MAQTTTKAAPRQQTVTNGAKPAQAVAVLPAPRLLPPEDGILAQYDVNREGWRTLTESIFPAAKTQTSVLMALEYCKRRRLDVFKHPVHIVPIWNSQAGDDGKGGMVETIWPGINELRTTAIRTGQYAGMDVPTFGPSISQKFEGKIKKWKNGQSFYETETAEVTFPEWCQITVYRVLGGNRVPFPGPRVYWLEAYASLRNDVDIPNSMWQGRPHGQLEKCAEAAALRRAFPEELGSDYSIDEIGAFTTHAPTDVTADGHASTEVPAEPRRADFTDPASSSQATTSPAGESDVGGQSANAAEAGGAPTVSSGQPAADEAGVTDVDEVPPEHAQPGQMLHFAKFAKVSEFCNFADPFLEKTNAEGARQFGKFYDGMLLAMEKGKPKAQEAAKDYLALIKKLSEPREPGQEG